ncbi:hypothetical protein LB566_23430 [Mesorhizobium sp. CA13]|uniref:hypothetical protein n=1 Tax=Mesorhizobium sp. CA13 TaxID=2876643 RepID=UPI001CCA60AC|nr:hypothetical protein [Mesorhizobium sp. CA13]MBZ9856748.1 hypothetical protein [Mesorhizobium sp. CA13]
MSGDRDLFESEEEARSARARLEIGNPFADAPAQAQRRGRGRPSGALNVKTKEFERYYTAMGFKDPLVGDAHFYSADPVALVAWFEEHEPNKKKRPSLWEIIREQNARSDALKPYLHGKKPVQVEIIDERLPTLIVDLGTNQLADARRLAEQRALSVGAPIEIEGETADTNENNDLAEDK